MSHGACSRYFQLLAIARAPVQGSSRLLSPAFALLVGRYLRPGEAGPPDARPWVKILEDYPHLPGDNVRCGHLGDSWLAYFCPRGVAEVAPGVTEVC